MQIRAETPDDLAAIHAVHVECFPTPAEAKLVDAIRASGNLAISLVAEVDGTVVGHVAFSPVTVAEASDGVGLAPVAVLPVFRRRGIADQLIRAGLAICERDKNGFVVVLGNPDYYGRFGFVAAAAFGLHDVYGGGDAFQALELRAGAIPKGASVVNYSPEFSSFE